MFSDPKIDKIKKVWLKKSFFKKVKVQDTSNFHCSILVKNFFYRIFRTLRIDNRLKIYFEKKYFTPEPYSEKFLELKKFEKFVL